MVLEGANIVSHMGDYPSHAHSEKERKEKAGETLIDTWCASETEETASCAVGQKQPKNPKIAMNTKWQGYIRRID